MSLTSDDTPNEPPAATSRWSTSARSPPIGRSGPTSASAPSSTSSARTLARLLLLPPHDPQFRRNRERVVRDAERENLVLEWDLGLPDEDVDYPRRAPCPPPAADPRASVFLAARLLSVFEVPPPWADREGRPLRSPFVRARPA